MRFINRKKEVNSFKTNYETYTQKNISQVYIVEAEHGIGKTEFIKEVSKFFAYYPLDILMSENSEELSAFKRFVLELDKTSTEHEYDDFKTFYEKKSNSNKAIQLLLKITAYFGQILAKSKNHDIELVSLIDKPVQYENFILKAQIENLFEYAKYVCNQIYIHAIFHNASFIDLGSLDLLSKLITTTKGNIFIFETNTAQNSSKIEYSIQNNHSIYLKKYFLNKLSKEHIETYIHQLLDELGLQAENIDSNILKESIEKGDLKEISIILKDYNDRLQKDTSAKIRSIKDIIESLSDSQKVLLITVAYANGKLNFYEIEDIVNELNNSFSISDINFLFEKKLIEECATCDKCNYILLQPFVYSIVNMKEFLPSLKYAVASGLIRNLNIKLIKNYNNRYVDVLVEYYINNKQFYQLKTLLSQICQRLNNFNTQAERIDYFKKFAANHLLLYKTDKEFAIQFAKIAYNSNLYFEAKNFINLVNESNEDIIFFKALVLNRCENFEQSENYINVNLKGLNKKSSLYFKLSLVLIMNLIQMNKRNDAAAIFNELVSFTQEPLYPYLIRLSNVFYSQYKERLKVVKSITSEFYRSNNNEFSGLHAIYLAYLYAITQQPELAEKSLLEARTFFGNNLIYNHMILHNEATIKFHSNQIDEDIPILLNNAKITAYDEYDQFAINNNLLVYYILSNNISNLECQKIVNELEEMLIHTNFKRFIDKIYYNLYHYYVRMFNLEKSNYYKGKLTLSNIDFDDN